LGGPPMWDSTTKVPDAGGSLAMSTESGSIVDSATTIVVDHDDERVVWNVGGDVPQRPVVFGQQVPFGAEGIEGRAQRGRPIDAPGRLVATAFTRYRHHTPDAELVALS
jgi:hypothetical protein